MVKIMEKPIKIDDLGVALFLETPKWHEPSKGDMGQVPWRVSFYKTLSHEKNTLAFSIILIYWLFKTGSLLLYGLL